MCARNLYGVLGVARRASQQAIQRAYRKRAFEVHPDRTGQEDLEELKQLNQAYEVLSDPTRRRAYDNDTTAAPAGPRSARGSRADGPCAESMRAGANSHSGSVRSPKAQRLVISVPAALARRGATLMLELDGKSHCSRCHGQGSFGDLVCLGCHGQGWKRQMKLVPLKIPPATVQGDLFQLPGRADLLLEIRLT